LFKKFTEFPLLAILQANTTKMKKKTFLQFPKGFIWGTSTAAAQVETAGDHNWNGVKAIDGYTFARTTDHEKRRTEDAGYISQFGSMYRGGVDWSRLQTKAFEPFDKDVVKEYRDFFQLLNSQGTQIMFVIHHFMNPNWFEKNNTWLNEDNIPAFVDYARQCVEHFGDLVANWNTFNEPNVYAINAYMMGAFPPFKKSYFKANRATKNMGKAHDIVYDLLKEAYPNKPVGISCNTVDFHGLNILGKMVAKFADWWFIDFVPKHFKKLDYWGLSYYAHIPLTPFPITEIDKPGELAKRGYVHDKMWAYKPEAFKKIIHRFHKKYGKPIMITENGICTDDSDVRIASMKDYLKIMHEVIDEGVDLKGYIHWSTWDNFEWNLGPTYRFGLVRIDLETMDRTMTKAGEYYSKVAKENGLEV
jgi:beta-glucosidase